MKKMVLLFVLLVIILSACSSSDFVESVKVDEQQSQYRDNQPIPSFDWSLERDILIQLYLKRNEAIATYTIITYSVGGAPIYECPSIGYPLPADTQLTNPLKVTTSGAVIEQAEPNGLFTSDNAFGTWVLCVLDDGTVYPVYTEQNATAFPFPVEQNEAGVFVPVSGAKPVSTIDIER